MMSNGYVFPKLNAKAFSCPECKCLSSQNWWLLGYKMQYVSMKLVEQEDYDYEWDKRMKGYAGPLIVVGKERASVSECQGCKSKCLWVGKNMVYPKIGTSPQPNDDLSEEVKKIYSEAALVLSPSPRAAAALLRLALQEFCKELGGKGNNLAEDIENLVKNHNLSEEMKEVMDTVRYVGNNAVHPGEIDLNDTRDIVKAMFEFINYIAERMISAPKARKSMIDRVKKSTNKPPK